MKRLIFRVAMLILTFLLGIGLDRVLSRQAQIQAPPPVALRIAEPFAAPVVVTTPPIATPTNHMIFDYDPEKFFPDGDYVLVGKKPKEFAEFRSMALWLNGTLDGQLSGGGGVVTMMNDKYDNQSAVFGLVTERRVFFVTSTFESGYEYRFDGEFLRRDLSVAANTNKAVLRGTLTKTRKGRKVAESVVSFRIEYHAC